MQSQKRGGLASYEARRRRTTLPHRAPPRAHPARRTRAQEIRDRSRRLEFRTAVEAIPDLHRFLSWIKPCEHGREEDERGGVVKRYACNRKFCWMRSRCLLNVIGTLSGDVVLPHSKKPGAMDANRAVLYMTLDKISKPYSKDSDVYKNIFGKESVTEAAGFYGGKKLNAKSVMVELVEREGKESLRAMACKAGTKKEEGISYKAAALCGFNIVPDNYKGARRLVEIWNQVVDASNKKVGKKATEFEDPMLPLPPEDHELPEELSFLTEEVLKQLMSEEQDLKVEQDLKELEPEEAEEALEHFNFESELTSEQANIKGQEGMDTSGQEEAKSATTETTTSEIEEEEDDDDMESMSDMEELDTTSITTEENTILKMEKLSDKTNSSKYDKYEKPKLKKVLIKRDHQLKKMRRQMKVDQEKHQKTRELFERLLQKTGVKEEDLVAEGCFGKEEEGSAEGASSGPSSRTTPTHAEYTIDAVVGLTDVE